jgi:hypothetical protein
MKITYVIDDKNARAALERFRPAVERNIEVSMDRAGIEVADEMRGEASEHDVFGNLKESIRMRQFAPLSRFIGPTASYARAAEEGTGPAAGKARYYPNPDNLLQFLTQSPAARGFGWAKKYSAKRDSQDLELWFRSRALAWAIYQKGTRAHPIVAPTAAKMEPRVLDLMRFGVDAGVKEAFSNV